MPQSVDNARTVRRRWPLISGASALAIGSLLGLLVLVRGNNPLEIDAEWMEEITENRTIWLEVPSYFFNFVGGGLFATILALALTVLFLILKRPWTALFIAAASLASVTIVHLLKAALGRARPDDIMLSLDSGSFPSGHTANAATLAVILGIIVWRWWVWALGAVYVVLMALSRTYLGAHWVTDTVGGLLIGAGIAVIVWAPFALRILAERHRRKDLAAL